jgi:ATP-dependent Clp protease ATP-binding subunit ClpC
MYERFTDRARKVMQLANQEAQRFNHEYIGTEHMLLGLVKEGSGVAANVLKNLDIDLRKIRQEVEKIVQTGPGWDTQKGKLPQTPRAKKVIEFAVEEARNLNHNYVGTEHLLLGLIREQEGVAAQVLMNLGLKLEDVRQEVLNLLGHKPLPPAKPVRTAMLDIYGRDLTDEAQRGLLPPAAGHDDAVDQVMAALCCRTGNVPLLVGHGSGPASVVAGLARRLVGGRVPDEFAGARVVALDDVKLAVGCKDRSQFADRLLALATELQIAKNVILYLWDMSPALALDRLAEPGPWRQLALAAADRQFACVGAVTPERFRRLAAEGGPLPAAFLPIRVAPATREAALETVRSLQNRYADHHRVRYAEAALAAAVERAGRLPGVWLPDAALRLLDLAGAQARLRSAAEAPDVRPIEAEIEALNAAKEAAVAEQDFARAASLRDQADQLKKRKDALLRESRERKAQAAVEVGPDDVAAAARRVEAAAPEPPADPPILR